MPHVRPRNALLVGLAVLAVLLLGGEVFCRFAYGPPSPPKPLYPDWSNVRDDEYGYRFRPGTTHPSGPKVNRINNLGLRGEDTTRAKPPGVYRVLCVGDSATNGVNVHNDQTYPAILQALFAHSRLKDGLRVEVLNAGVPGYLSDHHLRRLTREFLDLEPDLIVFMMGLTDVSAVIMTNDTWDAVRPPKPEPAGGALEAVRGWLRRVSALYYHGERQIRETLEIRRLTKNEKADLTREITAGLAIYAKNFQDMLDICKARGIAVLNVNYPWNVTSRVGREDNYAHVKAHTPYYAFNLYWQAAPLLTAANAELSAKNGVAFLDPQPLVSQAKDHLKFYGQGDFTHPSLEGNFLIAELTYQAIANTFLKDKMLQGCTCLDLTARYLLGIGAD